MQSAECAAAAHEEAVLPKLGGRDFGGICHAATFGVDGLQRNDVSVSQTCEIWQKMQELLL